MRRAQETVKTVVHIIVEIVQKKRRNLSEILSVGEENR